jgi:predicted Fe-Mo cluster-binding NifX family protein
VKKRKIENVTVENNEIENVTVEYNEIEAESGAGSNSIS